MGRTGGPLGGLGYDIRSRISNGDRSVTDAHVASTAARTGANVGAFERGHRPSHGRDRRRHPGVQPDDGPPTTISSGRAPRTGAGFTGPLTVVIPGSGRTPVWRATSESASGASPSIPAARTSSTRQWKWDASPGPASNGRAGTLTSPRELSTRRSTGVSTGARSGRATTSPGTFGLTRPTPTSSTSRRASSIVRQPTPTRPRASLVGWVC
jgi:hypothetical protein